MWINHKFKWSFIFVVDLNSLSFISEEQKGRGQSWVKAKFYSRKIGLKATEGQFVTVTGSEKRPIYTVWKIVTKKPAVIKELEKYFEKPEIAVQCLVEISKGNDP